MPLPTSRVASWVPSRLRQRLLPLLRRDTGFPAALNAAPEPLPGSFTEGLMERVTAASLSGRSPAARRRPGSGRGGRTARASLALTLGAAMLLVAGFGGTNSVLDL